MNLSLKIWVVCVLACQGGLAQGFLNLNFESAQIIPLVGSPYYPYGIEVTNALPGWTVSSSQAPGTMTYNDPATGSTWVTLLATNGQQISGNYSVLLQGGLTDAAASISQTGIVPALTSALFFDAQPSLSSGVGSLLVTLGGQDLSISALAAGSNYTLYGAAVPVDFIGQSEQLEFSVLNGAFNNWVIDNIQFSPSPVPEPNVVASSTFVMGKRG